MWKNKKFNIVISLLIAISLWVFVIGTMDPITTKSFQDVPVQIIHLQELSDRGLAIAKTSVKEINVTAQGKKSVMNETEFSDVNATIDAKDLTLGENKCRIKTSVSGKASVKNQSTSIAYVTVEKITSRNKDIVVTFSDEVGSDKEPTTISQSMYQVSVKGATSIIRRVDHVNALVSAEDISKSASKIDAKLVAVDKAGREVSNVVLSANTIQVEVVLYETKTVKLDYQIRGIGDKTVQKPEKVTVKGPSDILDSISAIVADDVYLYDINKSTQVELNLHLPQGVFVASTSEPMVVEVKIAGNVTKTFEVDADQIRVDTQDEYNIETNVINVTLTGPKSVLNSISKSDIKLYADANGKTGQINCEVKCHRIEGVSEIEINPKKIQITIEE